MIKLFDPETWSLGEPRELWVSKKANIADLNKVVSAAFGLPESSTHLTKINSPWSFHRVILPFQDWVCLSDKSFSDSYLHSAPFYLSTDGILFVLRDSTKSMREMSADEKLLFHCEEFES